MRLHQRGRSELRLPLSILRFACSASDIPSSNTITSTLHLAAYPPHTHRLSCDVFLQAQLRALRSFLDKPYLTLPVALRARFQLRPTPANGAQAIARGRQSNLT